MKCVTLLLVAKLVTLYMALAVMFRSTTLVLAGEASQSHPAGDGVGIFPANCGKNNRTEERVRTGIVGGRPVEYHAWPWLALIGFGNTRSAYIWLCSGTLITDLHVLTAADHVPSGQNDFSSLLVRLGEHDIRHNPDFRHVQDRRLADIIKHEMYQHDVQGFNIAILVLKKKVRLHDNIISPICLPFPSESLVVEQLGQSVWAVGWDLIMPWDLNVTKVPEEAEFKVLANSECERHGESVVYNERLLCFGADEAISGEHITCQGDSGGPLMGSTTIQGQKRYYQVGITTSQALGCVGESYSGVSVRVAPHLDWILGKVLDSL